MKLDDVFEDRDAYYDHDEIEADRARFEENLDEFFRSVSRKDWKTAIGALDEINWEDAPAPLADLMSRPGAHDWMDHKQELLRELLLWEIEHGHSNGIIDSFNQLDAPWPELKAINRLYNSNKPLLATASEWYPNEEELQDIYQLVMKNISTKLRNGKGRMALYDLVKLGLDIEDLPGARAVFDQHKPVIIKDLLKMVKSGQSAVNVEHYVDMLKDWGINWPELDIIDNSLAADRSAKKIAETDDETRRQGEEMMYTILKKQFDKNPWFGVYYMDEWGMTPDKVPGLRELLDSHKTTFITSMLKGMKGAGYIDDIKPQVERLEKVGADWPELAIIRKSIDASKDGLDEARSDNWPASTVLDRIKAKQTIALGQGMQELKYDGMKDALITGCLEPHDREIADWADGVLSKSPDSDMVIFQFIQLLHMKGKFPNLIAVLDKHRAPFIKYLLLIFKKLMSHNDMRPWLMDQLKAKVSALKDNGLAWPELAVLEKSMQAPTEVDEAEVLPKSAKSYQDSIRKNLTTLSSVVTDPMYDLMWHKSVNKFDHAARMRFLAGLHDEIMAYLDKAPTQRMVLLMLKLREFAPGWGNFDKILDHRIGELEAWVYHTLGGNNPSYILNRIKGLKDLGMDVSELKLRARELLTKRLKDIINNGPIYPTTGLNTTLAGLNDLGVVVKLGSKSPVLTKKLLSHVDDYIAGDGIGPNGTQLIDSIGKLFTNDDLSELLKPIYIKNKTGIMRKILTMIKSNGTNGALSDMERLRAAGIDWPEFEIIMKSMRAVGHGQVNESVQDSKMAQTFFRIESCLEEEDFQSIPYYFAVLGLGNGDHRFPAINLNGYKREIMFSLLAAIKDPEESNLDDEDLLPMIKGVRMLGGKWPELDVMEKSLVVRSKDIEEGSAAPFGSARVIVRVMLKRALARKHGDLNSDRNSAIDKMDINDPRFVSAVDSAKPLLLSEIRKLLKSDRWDANIRGWENILALHQVRVEWPELIAMLEDNKPTVIKSMLSAIKDDGGEEMARWPQIFKDMGMSWPELDIINKSLTQLDEDLGKWHGMYDNAIHVLLKNMMGQTQAEPYEPKLDPLRKEIYDYLLDRADSLWENDPIFVIRDMRTITALVFYGREWPELAEIVQDHKATVIKMLLGMFKAQHWDLSDVLQQIEQLRELNINWPELDIIEKGANSEHKLDEAEDNYDYVRFVSSIDDDDDGSEENVAYWLSRIGHEDDPLPYKKSFWSYTEREKVIRSVLLAIKNSAAWEFDDNDIRKMVYALKDKLGLNWPELNTIQRSLEIDAKNRGNDETV